MPPSQLNQDRLRLVYWPYIVALVVLFGVATFITVTNGWEAYAREWLNLLVRWLHIIYGIAWIGASFYFIFLENALERHGVRADLAGNIWTIHGGGVYYLEKYKSAPKRLPPFLHWFKWDAYLTWVTGFLLLVVVYYTNAETTLLRPGSSLTGTQGVLISLGSLIGAWLLYVALSSTGLLRRPAAFLAVGGVLIALITWGLSQVFSGRGTFIHVGAMLGTIMAANVFFVIIPSQKKLVKAAQKGKSLDPAFVAWVQLRSRHNNYLTLPVLYTMISNHFPMTYSTPLGWLILLLLFVAGVSVRHFINVTEKEHHDTVEKGGAMPYLLVAAAGAVFIAFLIAAPRGSTANADAPKVEFVRANQIVQERCTVCHAAKPTQPGFASAPAGLALDTPEQIAAHAQDIKRTSVDSDYMPLGNVTGMTEQEREELGAWIAQGARTK